MSISLTRLAIFGCSNSVTIFGFSNSVYGQLGRRRLLRIFKKTIEAENQSNSNRNLSYERDCSKQIKMQTADDVYNFWFPADKTNKEKLGIWFGAGGPDFDRRIKDEFGDLVVKARNGELSSWKELGCLKSNVAFIILIDQFCRNIYRGTADAFSHDAKALAVAIKLVESVRYKELKADERFFVILPFMHHEDPKSQARCVELSDELYNDCKGTEHEVLGSGQVDYARKHQEVIQKFGRYIGRNAALGRQSTPEEEEALKSGQYNF